jgi:hypothetical protein
MLCLRMEDHHVRVRRVSGSSLELMPLREAIERFGGGVDGAQIHRSWWVAARAVAGAERDARNWRLRLTNGLTAPVAHNRIAEARARGWIDGDASASRCPGAKKAALAGCLLPLQIPHRTEILEALRGPTPRRPNPTAVDERVRAACSNWQVG